MNIVAIIPGILAAIWMLRRDYREAYIDIYLFSLFLLPGWCRFVAPALPDPTFNEAALLPIIAVFLVRGLRGWRVSATDAMVFGFALLVGYSENTNAGFKEAQNLMFDMLAAGVLPYIAAKGIINTQALRVRFVKRVVWLLGIVTVFFVYEWRFAYNPFRLIFDRFFPGQGDGWVTTFRYGFARTAGPYGHAILAGIVIMVGFRLQRWLENSGLWEQRFRRFHPGPWSKARLLTVAMLAGLVMTMVRGPQIGAVIASVVSLIGAARNPRRRARWVAAAVVLIGIPAGIVSYTYASVGRAAAKTASQESAAYRKELIDKYVDIAEQHAALGWGRNGWPKVPGMPSIDNYYLLLSLMHGVIATGLLLTILVTLFWRLLRNGLKWGPLQPRGSSLSFCLSGIFAGFTFSILTVYMGDNVIPIFFTLVGFAEGYLQAGGDQQATSAAVAGTPKAAEPVPARFPVVFC
jgi:hypothetical protein